LNHNWILLGVLFCLSTQQNTKWSSCRTNNKNMSWWFSNLRGLRYDMGIHGVGQSPWKLRSGSPAKWKTPPIFLSICWNLGNHFFSASKCYSFPGSGKQKPIQFESWKAKFKKLLEIILNQMSSLLNDPLRFVVAEDSNQHQSTSLHTHTHKYIQTGLEQIVVQCLSPIDPESTLGLRDSLLHLCLVLWLKKIKQKVFQDHTPRYMWVGLEGINVDKYTIHLKLYKFTNLDSFSDIRRFPTLSYLLGSGIRARSL